MPAGREAVRPGTLSRDAQAADKVLGLSRVTSRAVRAGYLTEETAGQWLDHLARRPFFCSLTLFIVTAAAIAVTP